MAHGIRKVNEYIVREGRALVMTQDITKSINQAEWNSVADGTVYIDSVNRKIKIKSPAKSGEADTVTWRSLNPMQCFDSKSIQGDLLADRTITEVKMAANSIDTNSIIDRKVTSAKIGLKQVKDEHFEVNSLNGDRVKDYTLNAVKIIKNSCTKDVCDSLFTSQSLAGSKLVNNSVGNTQLSANCIQRGNIVNGEIILEKMASNSVGNSQLVNGCVTSSKIGNGAVGNSALALNSVDYGNIKPNAVRLGHINENAVDNNALGLNAVKRENVMDGEIIGSKLSTDSVSTAKIVNGNVTKDKLSNDVKTVVNNAVVLNNGKATVLGNLQVNGNITADPSVSTCTYSVSGFKVYNPLFADYAEGFVAAEPVEVGDIVEVDRCSCIRKASAGSRKVVGVVSDRYGICLDADEDELESGVKTPVGLLGKIPVNVMGLVEAGDLIVSAGEGIGIANNHPKCGTVIGKALEDKTTQGIGQVLCLIK